MVEEGLDARAAEIRKMRGQETVEALAGVFGGDDEFGGAREIARDIVLFWVFVTGFITNFVGGFVKRFIRRGVS